MTREQLTRQRREAVNRGVPIESLALRVAEYARVSTDREAQRASLSNQLETYREKIDRTPAWTYAGTYSDEGITGTRTDLRGGFRRLLADAKEGCFDLVLVKSVSRFARNLRQALNAVEELTGCGVMLWFDTERLNSFSDTGRAYFAMFALAAEWESRAASARVRSTMERGIQNGRIYGSSGMLGYRKEGCRLTVNEAEAPVVRLIFDLYTEEGLGVRRIARRLAEQGLARSDGRALSLKTVRDVLTNPKYKGWFCGGKSVGDEITHRRCALPEERWLCRPDAAVPALVSEAQWEKARRIRLARSGSLQRSPPPPGHYRYSGLVRHEARPDRAATHVFCGKGEGRREAWQNRHPTEGVLGPTLYTDELDRVLCRVLTALLGPLPALAGQLAGLYGEAGPELLPAVTRALLQLQPGRETLVLAVQALWVRQESTHACVLLEAELADGGRLGFELQRRRGKQSCLCGPQDS